ncbi:MAG: transposase, partial [Rhodoferax sp.]|nr:transposase [Rhodoferax sp.]
QQALPLAHVVETRQVFDLPVLQFEVTEHHAMQATCRCGHVHTAEFPAGVNAALQYGPRAQAAMVHFNQNHAVSVQRTAALMKDFFGLPVSQATVLKATTTSAGILKPAVDAIGQAAVNTAILHADETGLRVAKTLHWLHVLATDTLTWMGFGVAQHLHDLLDGLLLGGDGLLWSINGEWHVVDLIPLGIA